MSGPALPIRMSLASASSDRPGHPATEVLSLDMTTYWRAAASHGRVELELHPPSALHSLLIYNAGAVEMAIYASDKASDSFDRRSYVGFRPPKSGHATQGDAVELLPRSRPFSAMARGCVILRIGRNYL